MKRLGTLKKNRIVKLNTIGFLWSAPSHVERIGALTVAWNESFARYRAFVEKNGIHCASRMNSKMLRWVKKQRANMRSGTMKKDRMDKLNEIGFPWSAAIASERTDVLTNAWDRNFAMYRDFVEKNGICCTPKRNSKLCNWFFSQRKMMKFGKMKKDRMDRLNEIGFPWSPLSISQRSNPANLSSSAQRNRTTTPEISFESSLDHQSNLKHSVLLEQNITFGHCSAVVSSRCHALTLDTPLVDAAVSNKGCDRPDELQLGHNSCAVDEQSAFLYENCAFTSERDGRPEAGHSRLRSESGCEKEESFGSLTPHGLETPHISVRSESEFEKAKSPKPTSRHGIETPHIMGRRESECEKVQDLGAAIPHGDGLSFGTNKQKK